MVGSQLEREFKARGIMVKCKRWRKGGVWGRGRMLVWSEQRRENMLYVRTVVEKEWNILYLW